jgi:hypothetical protein
MHTSQLRPRKQQSNSTSHKLCHSSCGSTSCIRTQTTHNALCCLVAAHHMAQAVLQGKHIAIPAHCAFPLFAGRIPTVTRTALCCKESTLPTANAVHCRCWPAAHHQTLAAPRYCSTNRHLTNGSAPAAITLLAATHVLQHSWRRECITHIASCCKANTSPSQLAAHSHCLLAALHQALAAPCYCSTNRHLLEHSADLLVSPQPCCCLAHTCCATGAMCSCNVPTRTALCCKARTSPFGDEIHARCAFPLLAGRTQSGTCRTTLLQHKLTTCRTQRCSRSHAACCHTSMATAAGASALRALHHAARRTHRQPCCAFLLFSGCP